MNLNVSPLCKLGKGEGQAQSWAREVKGLYAAAGGEVPEYIERLVSPVRERYSTHRMRNEDILATNTEVTQVLREFVHQYLV